MISINERLSVPESEIEWSFARSGGPGGQNVNKVSSKAFLRWRLAANESLPVEVRARLRTLQARRMTTEGDMLFTSQLTRDQERNKLDCVEKLRVAVEQALRVPVVRKETKPSKGAKRRRLADKKARSAVKQSRRPVGDD